MRIPFTKVYRAFPEFDSLPDEECQRYMRQVRAHHHALIDLAPAIAIFLLLVTWSVGWSYLYSMQHAFVAHWVPMPDSSEGRAIELLISTVLVASIGGLLLRDFFMWLGLRAEVGQTKCPKCEQSLLGVPVQEVGLGDDPAKRFIRCPECGRKFNLLEIGITPRDLIPFEHRAVAPDFAKKRYG